MFIYAKNNEQAAEVVKLLFCYSNVQVSNINRIRILQLIFDKYAKTSSALVHRLRGPTKSEGDLFFHDLLVFKAEFKERTRTVTQDCKVGALTRFCTKIFGLAFQMFFASLCLRAFRFDDDIRDL